MDESVRLGTFYAKKGSHKPYDLSKNTLNEKISFQVEDKMKATRLAEAKVASKRAKIADFTSQIMGYRAKEETDFTNKLMRKACRQDNYNKLCYLAN